MMNSSICAAQTALLKTVQDIQDRAEVEQCLQDMLIDVELSIQLQERLQTHQQIQALQHRIQEQEYIIAETKAVRKQTQQYEVSIANSLMEELLTLSIELGTLKEIKQEHEQLLIQYDEVVAKLMQVEEDRNQTVEKKKQATNDATTTASPTHDVTNDSTNTAVEYNMVKTKAKVDAIAFNATTKVPVDPEIEPTVPKDDDIKIDEPPELLPKETPEIESILNFPTLNSSDHELDDVVGTVALVKELRFDEFEKGIFLKIFSFLDAIDILNTAQINVSMYSRVDSFFDFGDTTTQDVEDEKQQQQQQNAPSLNVQSTTDSIPAEHFISSGSTTSQIKTETKPIETTGMKIPPKTTSAIVHQPTVVTLPPLVSAKNSTLTAPSPSSATTIQPNISNFSTPTANATTPSLMAIPVLTSPPTHVPSKSNDSALLNRSIFSLLQPRQRQSTSMAAVTTGNGNVSPVPSPARNFLRPLTDQRTNNPTTANNTTGGTLTMNATMANSMAAKLSDAELNAIILMTERLKQKEILADKLTKENETLLAKLDGTEGVKQFLINKVRDMEISLSSLILNETKVVQQIASDQEVIAFLDGRVQKLEHTTHALEAEKDASKTELERAQKQSAQKVTVISDMLQFEREKLADQEREWKMTKKLLIKEIKNCRSQIIGLQSERDGYREQSDTLRRALLSPSSSNNSHSLNHSTGSTNGNSSKHQHRDRAYA